MVLVHRSQLLKDRTSEALLSKALLYKALDVSQQNEFIHSQRR